MTGKLLVPVKVGELLFELRRIVLTDRDMRRLTLGTSLVCAHLSNSRTVSGYWPILSAMQTSAASKSATLCLLKCLMLKMD